jgi:hypothetical protein
MPHTTDYLTRALPRHAAVTVTSMGISLQSIGSRASPIGDER